MVVKQGFSVFIRPLKIFERRFDLSKHLEKTLKATTKNRLIAFNKSSRKMVVRPHWRLVHKVSPTPRKW